MFPSTIESSRRVACEYFLVAARTNVIQELVQVSNEMKISGKYCFTEDEIVEEIFKRFIRFSNEHPCETDRILDAFKHLYTENKIDQIFFITVLQC